MKRTIESVLVVIFLGARSEPHSPRPNTTPRTWQAVQTYDVMTLSKNLEAHTRQLVGVKFSFRGKDIHHLKPNWYESSIWQPIPGESGKVARLSVGC